MSALKLQVNTPETIALAFADGVSVSSQFGGDQIMYTLSDGRKWYVAPFVAGKIREAGVAAGQPFTICKRELLTGNRRLVSYEVTAAAAPVPSAPLPGNGHNGLHAVPTAPVPVDPMREYFQTTPSVAARPLPVQPAAVPVPAPTPAPAAPPVPTIEGAAAAAMRLAGKLAVDAVLETEAYAQSRGMVDFVLGAENLQKIMVSLYIDLRKGGRA